jgi:hypothetical protein
MKKQFLSLAGLFSLLLLTALVLPKATYAFVFTDTFTATNGTNLETYNSDYDDDHNSLTIQNNAVAPNNQAIAVNNHTFTDGCMSMDWTGNSTNTNMAVRYNDTPSQTFYNFLHQNNNGDWLLRGFYSGSYHTIASGNNSFSGTHTYKLCAIGNNISVYKDGSLFASGTDTGVTGSGFQLFFSSATATTMDNLTIADLAGLDGCDIGAFCDTFTNTNGTELETHNADYDTTGSMQIQSNAIAPGTLAYVNNHNFTDGCISMDWTGNSSNTNMAIRYAESPANVFYNFLQHNNNGDWLLRGFYSGSYTTIASGNNSFSGTHTYKLCAIGNNISVYKDGSLLGSGTNSGVTSSGQQIFYSQDNVPMDNLKIWDIQ